VPIPKTRRELVDQIEAAFRKLSAELHDVDAKMADKVCVDDWSIRELLGVRLWWTQHVLDWIDEGRQGKVPVTPAKGYRWNETPRLNADIVGSVKNRSFDAIVRDLQKQYKRLLSTIEELDDDELLEVGTYEWAGRYPISRWLSINTTRQYQTARTYIRRVKKQRGNS
jgi:hypothetical protein